MWLFSKGALLTFPMHCLNFLSVMDTDSNQLVLALSLIVCLFSPLCSSCWPPALSRGFWRSVDWWVLDCVKQAEELWKLTASPVQFNFFSWLSTCPSDLRCAVPRQCALAAEAHVCTNVALSGWTVHSGAGLLKWVHPFHACKQILCEAFLQWPVFNWAAMEVVSLRLGIIINVPDRLISYFQLLNCNEMHYHARIYIYKY